LEGAGAVGGRDAEDEVADRGVAVVEDLLDDSIANGHLLAAASAARILGKIGTVDVLYRKLPLPSVLVEAARHADRRLRFSALGAIVALRPTKPYPGSSFVLDALGFFASSSGAPRALVGHPRAFAAEQEAGLLATLGYETHVATCDRDLLAAATASPDLELALIDFKLAVRTSGELLERIHADSRTARLPIGIVAGANCSSTRCCAPRPASRSRRCRWPAVSRECSGPWQSSAGSLPSATAATCIC